MKRLRPHLSVSLLGLIALSPTALPGCTEDNPDYVDPSTLTPCERGTLVIEPFEMTDPWMVDVLLVVDNSSGMGEVQTALSQAMPDFIEALNAIEGLDYHVGVITTDIVSSEQQGRLQTGVTGQATCPGNRPRVIDRNTPSGGVVAACNVVVGESGDNFEAGLEAIRYAMLGPAAQPGGENEGFFRPGARLVVIIISNEDDCSDDGSLDRQSPNECVWDRSLLIPLDVYVGPEGFFHLIKGQAGQPVDVVAIVGPDDGFVYEEGDPPRPVCVSNGDAFSGRRYISVVDSLGERGEFYSICTRSYDRILAEIVADHVAPRPEDICPFLTLTQPPVEVRVVDTTDGDRETAIAEAPSGYLYVGPDEECASGAIRIAPEARDVYSSERIEVNYCTQDPIP